MRQNIEKKTDSIIEVVYYYSTFRFWNCFSTPNKKKKVYYYQNIYISFSCSDDYTPLKPFIPMKSLCWVGLIVIRISEPEQIANVIISITRKTLERKRRYSIESHKTLITERLNELGYKHRLNLF